MKRIDQLQQLSREHHQALVLANRCNKVAATADFDACHGQWQQVRALFLNELMPPRIEEQCLIAPLQRLNNTQLRDRLLHEHGLLQACVFEAVEPETPALVKRLRHFGKLLADHVRFEERLLFPYLEQQLSTEELGRIDAACSAR